MGFMRRALYSSVGKAAQRAARRAFEQSEIGRLIEQTRTASLSQELRTISPESSVVAEAIRHVQRFNRPEALRAMLGQDARTLLVDVARYAKGDSLQRAILDSFLDSLGPVGGLIRSIGKAASKSRSRRTADDQLDAARTLLESFGYEVLPPRGRETPNDIARGIEAATEFLNRHGFEVTKKGAEPPAPPGVPLTAPSAPVPAAREDEQPAEKPLPGGHSPKTKAGTPRKVVDLPMGAGTRRFPVSHPIVTASWIHTPESSNVYAFRYVYDTRTLHVAFRQWTPTQGKSRARGPIYGYYHVPPGVFLGFIEAPSKGSFVWDALRVRGTVSGHQYDYRLVATKGEYVPRKATLTPQGEWFVQRTVTGRGVRTGKQYTLTSQLPSGPAMRGVPFRGGPDRGTPDRGR